MSFSLNRSGFSVKMLDCTKKTSDVCHRARENESVVVQKPQKDVNYSLTGKKHLEVLLNPRFFRGSNGGFMISGSLNGQEAQTRRGAQIKISKVQKNPTRTRSEARIRVPPDCNSTTVCFMCGRSPATFPKRTF